MPIHVTRRRRKGGPWYARGTVRVGKTRIVVAEFSTGCHGRAAADAAAEAEERRLRAELAEGAAGRPDLTIAEAIATYAARPGGVQPYDAARLRDFNRVIGERPLAEAGGAWSAWCDQRAGGMAPATVARCRAVLQAALLHAGRHHHTPAPVLASVAVKAGAHSRIAYLSHREADRLVAAYSPAARPVALVLRYQGLRTQEALRLDWRAVDWRRRTLFITASAAIGEMRTKSRHSRTIPMHRRVRVQLYLLWRRRDRPASGPVFISSRGVPYADTRGVGGNPLKKQHMTACRAAGVTGFRVHDWRHHWASHLVMAGVDIPTLMRLGGWQDHRMVLRYAAVGTEHMAAAIAKVA
jgi:integrase